MLSENDDKLLKVLIKLLIFYILKFYLIITFNSTGNLFIHFYKKSISNCHNLSIITNPFYFYLYFELNLEIYLKISILTILFNFSI